MSPTHRSDDVSALEADIARTREDLASTVDQLAAKLDVPSRVRGRLLTDDGSPKPVAVAIGTAVVATVVALVVLRARRRRS